MTAISEILVALQAKKARLDEEVSYKEREIELLRGSILAVEAEICEEKARLHLNLKVDNKLEALARIHGINLTYLARLSAGCNPQAIRDWYKLPPCPACGKTRGAIFAAVGEFSRKEHQYIEHLETHPNIFVHLLMKIKRGWSRRKISEGRHWSELTKENTKEWELFLAEWKKNS